MKPSHKSKHSPERQSRAMRLAIRLYWRELKRKKLYALLGTLPPAIGTAFIFYVPPLIISKILGRFNTGAPTLSDLQPYIIAFALIWAAGEGLWRVGLQYAAKAQFYSLMFLYNEALERLAEKDIKFFHDNFAGSLSKKALGYAKRYEQVFDTIDFELLPSILPLPFVGFILWQFSPWLIVVLIGMLVLTMSTLMPLIKRRQKLVAAREVAGNVMAGHLADIVANMDAVKAFAHEDYERQKYAQHVHDFMIKSKKTWDYHNMRINMVASPYYVLTNLAGLILAIYASRHTGLQIQAVFLTFSYYASATRVMFDFNHIYRNLESAMSEVAEFTELLLDEPRLNDAPNAVDFTATKGAIEFRDVSFRYHDSKADHLFQNLNLQIKSGEKVALVGHSGGGKTTITKLLLRFMDITGGQILIDGQDIATTTQAALRQGIAYVPQEPIMFHRSLADNIRYGRLDATDADIKQVAKLAHATEFIQNLPDKYETLVGERGVKLSGGQRQRIAIARAMIKDAPILVLDEATSALDSESEKLIQSALWELMKGRTAIVIAHRLSTIQKMDRIIVLDNGQIAEQGTHQQLLQSKGIYANLWGHQSGGFLED